ncbi:MAG: MFS transporter [Acidihalobacter sp.]|uniref:MFS transporter n=1 Tax=Acidihalobacter sp. TaxID=1872108 RepID=UPI00307F2444
MPETHSRSTRAEILLLTLAPILVVGQMYVVIPLFVSMGMNFGRPAADLVVTSSAFGIPYAFAGLIAGPLADAWGAKKVIVLSLCATAFSTLTVAFSPSYTGLVVMRGLQGITAGFLSAPVFAYIARDLEEDVRALATTAVMAAALSSAILMQLYGQIVDGFFGWRFVFLSLVPMILFSVSAANRLLVRSATNVDRRIFKAVLTLPGLLRRWHLLALYAAALTLLGGFVAVWSGIALYGPEYLRSDPARLFLLRASALPVMVAIPFVALRLRNLSPLVRIVSGLGVAALSLGASAFATNNVLGFASGLSVCVAGILIAAPAIVQGVMQAASDASGAAVSLYTFSIFLGASLGPQFAVVLEPTGIVGLLLGTAVLFMAGAIFGAMGATGTKAGHQ